MQKKLCFIGAGNMATSITNGLIKQGMPTHQIVMSDPSCKRRSDIQQSLSVMCLEHNSQAIAKADIIILAVKPQKMLSICQELATFLGNRKAFTPLIISIAAGITTTQLANHLGTDTAIIRAMPNTPALVHKGATALYANHAVSPTQRNDAEQILSSIGITQWLTQEHDLDAITALSGSGPAYFFLMIEAMIDAGVAMGLTPDLAKTFTVQTALGAAELAQTRTETIQQLRHNVTSPGGTTEAALKVMEQAGYKDLIQATLSAAQARASELASS